MLVFQGNQQINPYALAISKINDEDLKEIGSVKKIFSEKVIQEIRELASILLQQPIINEKNDRTVRVHKINQGEIAIYCTNKERGATVGNHASGGERCSLIIIIEATKAVLFKQCTSVEETNVITSFLYKNEVSIIFPGQLHALRLPSGSQMLTISNKEWIAAKANSARELISYDFDDQ